MLAITTIIPGATVATDPIALPDGAPRIDTIHRAVLYQVQAASDGEIAAGAIPAHTLDTQVAVGGAVTNALGHDATPELETAADANVSIAGAISAHDAASVTFDAPGANPVVEIDAADITLIDQDSFSLDAQAVENGELLIVYYIEVGAVPRVA